MPQNINFSIEKARRLQTILSKKIITRDCFSSHIRYVAGVDVTYIDTVSIGAAAVLDYNSMETIEVKTSKVATCFPYIPTLLSFREVPPIVSAIRKLVTKPDVFLVDGQGLSHPYRLGFASHLGLVLDAVTVGVAKEVLCGKVLEKGEDKFWKPIIYEGKIVGGAVFTKPNAKPIYVSIGHKISLETAIKIVLECTRGYRVPEPIREAHMSAEKIKRKIVAEANLSEKE